MFIPFDDPSVRLTGRFATCGKAAVATATGSAIEAAFSGKMAVLHFDISNCEYPYPHLWIQVDGGARIEAAIDKYLRIHTDGEGPHIVKVIFKSENECQPRWYQPLVAKLAFEGLDADSPAALPEDDRKTIEFVGDSITEGILIDVEYAPYENDMDNRCFQNDVTATYAHLIAENLNLRKYTMGYGAVGATRSGNGCVPKVAVSYPFCFDGAPVEYSDPDFIMINHGANDWAVSAQAYTREYALLLDVVRKTHPTSQIVVLSAFCGRYHAELGEMVEKYNEENGTDIFFIDSNGWVPPEPLHPLRDGHKIIADNVTAIMKERFFA